MEKDRQMERSMVLDEIIDSDIEQMTDEIENKAETRIVTKYVVQENCPSYSGCNCNEHCMLYPEVKNILEKHPYMIK